MPSLERHCARADLIKVMQILNGIKGFGLTNVSPCPGSYPNSRKFMFLEDETLKLLFRNLSSQPMKCSTSPYQIVRLAGNI